MNQYGLRMQVCMWGHTHSCHMRTHDSRSDNSAFSGSCDAIAVSPNLLGATHHQISIPEPGRKRLTLLQCVSESRLSLGKFPNVMSCSFVRSFFPATTSDLRWRSVNACARNWVSSSASGHLLRSSVSTQGN